MSSGGSGWLVADMTAAQYDSVALTNRLFIRIKPQEEYNGDIPKEVVGSAVRYDGLSRIPTFYWKQRYADGLEPN